MKYSLSDDTWDQKEIAAIQTVIDSNRFSMGQQVSVFEKEFAKRFHVKYAVMVNSGSSANLLAIAAMVYSGKLQAGDEVLVPAVSWSTTYFPLMQFGLKLRFVDIDKETLNIDINKFNAAITPRSKMVFLVNLLGNSNDFSQLKRICENHNLIMLEDNCESLGAEYEGRKVGTFGLLGTFSTFYSHHLCTMEGGVVVTDDEVLYHYMLCIRAHGWTRNLPQDSPIYEKNADEFYESFNFIVPGFNLRPLEMEAAIGLEQLQKMDDIIIQRRKNADYFCSQMAQFKNLRIQREIGSSSWFGFAIVLQNELQGKRNYVISRLKEADVEVRPIVAGNFTRNKVISYMNYTIADELVAADDIHFNGFFIGNHCRNIQKEIDAFVSIIKEVTDELEAM